MKDKKILIISNNVLSETDNNGKTILSYFDSMPKSQIKQLYFNSNLPTVVGYDYYQVSDKDIITGLINKKRGRQVSCKVSDSSSSGGFHFPVFQFSRLLRDMIWHHHWLSDDLVCWLDSFNPDCIFFVAGDALFSFEICNYIKFRYGCDLFTYVTDDYYISYKTDGLMAAYRKNLLRKALKQTLSYTKCFFTISEKMRKAYISLFDTDSITIVNMPEPITIEAMQNKNDRFVIVYAGSLYYGRDKEIVQLSSLIEEFNSKNAKKIEIDIYSNNCSDVSVAKKFKSSTCCKLLGSVDKKTLMYELISADVLLFVESFNKKYMNRTRLSLSTKVPEYLATKKPILAIGPADIGSMEYLDDVAFCINNTDSLMYKEKLFHFLQDDAERFILANKAYEKYCKNHNKGKKQHEFEKIILGDCYQ